MLSSEGAGRKDSSPIMESQEAADARLLGKPCHILSRLGEFDVVGERKESDSIMESQEAADSMRLGEPRHISL